MIYKVLRRNFLQVLRSRDEILTADQSRPHAIKVSDIGIPKEVMKDCDDPRDLLRELISNAGAKEVNADTVEIFKFTEPEYGLSFRVKDDGCGMDYTGDESNQGRLDRFLNLGYSEVSGLESDEFSHKGLGSALIYNSRRVEIETYDGDTLYEVVIEDPRGHFWKENPEPPTPRITAHPDVERKETGTKINIYGFDGGGTSHYKKYNFSRMKEYLRWRTLVGCTKEDRENNIPNFKLNVEGEEEVLEPGFPWIEDDGSEDTVIFDPVTVKKEKEGTSIEVTVKGGMTLNVSDQGLKKDYAGLTVSVNGIPYFRERKFVKSHFSDVKWDFINLVVECDDLNLNISRNGYYKDDIKGKLFKNAVNQALRKIEDSEAYKRFASHVRRVKRENRADSLGERKRELQSESHKYVALNGEILHTSPQSEQDTLAVLWKLEGKNALPFHHFKTLEHASQEGMDLIIDFQEKRDSEKKDCVSVEVERNFSNFESHSHTPGQTDYVICWNMNRDSVTGNVKKLSDYKYLYRSGDQTIEVFSLQDLDEIEVRQLSEIES